MQVDNRLDKMGIACSGACAIHCMLAPIVTLASPAMASYAENEWIHLVLLLLIVPLAVVAFHRSMKLHKKTHPSWLGGIGVGFLLSAVIFEGLFEIGKLEVALTAIGCVFLISAHILNINCLGCRFKSDEANSP